MGGNLWPQSTRGGNCPGQCYSIQYPLTLVRLCSPNRFPFYFELKIAFVIWLLSPYTKGSSVLYRKFVHPTLSNKEKVRPHLQLFPA